jgi:recombination protein RecT
MASTQVAEQRANPLAVIRQNLQAMAPEFKAALPASISASRSSRASP